MGSRLTPLPPKKPSRLGRFVARVLLPGNQGSAAEWRGPSEEQRAEAQRLVDEQADAARADLRTVGKDYTAKARLLRTGALEVEIRGCTYLVDREGKIVAERKDGLVIGAVLAIGVGLFALGFTGCNGADKFSGGDTQARDRLFWVSAGAAALGGLLMSLGGALSGLRWSMKRGRGAVDPLRSGRWFDIPPTPRSPNPPFQPGKRRRIHPLEMVDELPQSDDHGGDDAGDDGDSD